MRLRRQEITANFAPTSMLAFIGSRSAKPLLNRKLACTICAVAIGATTQQRAHADEGGDVDLRSFRPSTDPSGTLATEGLKTPGSGNLQFGFWTSIGASLLRVREVDGTSVRPIRSQLVVAPSLAVGIGSRAAVGLTAPAVLFQGGDASSVTEQRAIAHQGIGDVSLTGKMSAVLPDPDLGGWGVGFVSRVSFPTGDRRSFIGDSGMTVETRALAA